MDIHDYPAALKLHPELRQMKPDDSRLFIFTEIVEAMKKYAKPDHH